MVHYLKLKLSFIIIHPACLVPCVYFFYIHILIHDHLAVRLVPRYHLEVMDQTLISLNTPIKRHNKMYDSHGLYFMAYANREDAHQALRL